MSCKKLANKNCLLSYALLPLINQSAGACMYACVYIATRRIGFMHKLQRMLYLNRNYAVKYALQWRYISFWWLAPTFRLQQTLGNITKTHARCLLSLCVYGGAAAWHFVMNVCVWLFCEVVVFVLQLYFGKPWFREKVLTTKALT